MSPQQKNYALISTLWHNKCLSEVNKDCNEHLLKMKPCEKCTLIRYIYKLSAIAGIIEKPETKIPLKN